MLGWRSHTHAPVIPLRAGRRQDRAGAPPPEQPADGVAATAFAVVLLVLGIGLVFWAPWRATEPALISGYAPRGEQALVASGSAPVGPVSPPPSQPSSGAAASTAPAPAPAGLLEASRPAGLPLRRDDWIILRDYAANGGSSPNGAIDLAVENNRDAIGTPIHATHDGTVRVLRKNRLYGNLVAIKNSRWSTTYGHLDQALVTDGQQVRRGDQIGTMGMTGVTTSPHLDYQVWENTNGVETNRNPIDFLESR